MSRRVLAAEERYIIRCPIQKPGVQQLDILDVRILREFVQDRESHPLQSEVRKSFRAVAEKLDVDEATVRNRVRRLFASGFIEEWNVIINPGLLGLRFSQFRCNVADVSAKQETIQRIMLVHGVLMVTDFFGSALRITAFHEDKQTELDQKDLISGLCGAEIIVGSDMGFPACSVRLTAADWQLIKSIRTDPWKRFKEISRETSLSTKTVKRRLIRLIEGKALYMTMSIDPKALRGVIPAELLVVYESAEAKRKANGGVVSRLSDMLLSAQVGDREHALFMLLLGNVYEATLFLRWLKGRSGIREAYLDIVQERIELYGNLDRKISSVLKTREHEHA